MEPQSSEPSPVFSTGDITITGTDLVYREKTISLSRVTAIRFGWFPMRLYHFMIGSRWMLELKTEHDKLRMYFPSYFGLFKNRQYENFNTLLDVIWDITVVRLVNAMIHDINNGKTVAIGKCAVGRDGILLKDLFIEWDDLLYQKKYNRLTINSRSHPDIWTNLYYTETDNVHVLMGFLESKFERAGGL